MQYGTKYRTSFCNMKSEHKISWKYTVEYSAGEENAGTHSRERKIKNKKNSHREFCSANIIRKTRCTHTHTHTHTWHLSSECVLVETCTFITAWRLYFKTQSANKGKETYEFIFFFKGTCMCVLAKWFIIVQVGITYLSFCVHNL